MNVLLIATLQSWTIIVLFISIFAVTVAGSAAKRGLVAVFLVINLVAVFNGREARFHLVEFRGAHNVLLTRRKNGCNLFLRFLNAVGRLRVRCKSFGQSAGLLLLLRLQLFKESHKSVGIITGLVHILQAQVISFCLKATGKLQEGQREANSGKLAGCITGAAAHKNQRNGENVCELRFGRSTGSMAGGYVGDLMGHHTGQLCLFISSQNQSGVHVEEAARKGESVDFVGIHNFDRERHLSIRVTDQVLADAVYILIHHRVLNHPHALFDLLGIFLAHADFFFNRIPVHAAELAVADGVYVIFAAIMLWLGFFGILVFALVVRGGRLALLVVILLVFIVGSRRR